jgi:hypothetical protein
VPTSHFCFVSYIQYLQYSLESMISFVNFKIVGSDMSVPFHFIAPYWLKSLCKLRPGIWYDIKETWPLLMFSAFHFITIFNLQYYHRQHNSIFTLETKLFYSQHVSARRAIIRWYINTTPKALNSFLIWYHTSVSFG